MNIAPESKCPARYCKYSEKKKTSLLNKFGETLEKQRSVGLFRIFDRFFHEMHLHRGRAYTAV